MKVARKLWTWALALVATFAVVLGLSTVARADISAPVTNKTLHDNGDGSYTLSLSVTGTADSSSESDKANVIIILDVSGSMRYPVNNISDTGRYGWNYGGNNASNDRFIPLYTRSGNWPNYSYTQINNDTTTGTVYRNTGGNNYEAYTGARYTAQDSTSRLDVTKNAVNELITTLAAQNSTETPDMVEISFITFSSDAAYASPTSASGTWWSGTNTTALTNIVNNSTAVGGTNWDDALYHAEQLNSNHTQTDETTYIVFFSDGDPTFSNTTSNDSVTSHTHGNTSNDGGNGSTSQPREYNSAYYHANRLHNAGTKLYSIYAFGDNQTYMQTVTSYGNYGNSSTTVTGTYFFPANDTASIDAAFAQIANSISNAINVDHVDITDQITGLTATTLVNNATDFKYYRAGGENNKYGEFHPDQGSYGTEWTTITADGASEATFTEGTGVEWKLGDNYKLEDGVTYTVTFTVWPSQAAYDLVADLNNEKRDFDDLTDDEKAQVVRTGAGTEESPYVYSIKTNPDGGAKINYNVTDETNQTQEPTDSNGNPITWSADGTYSETITNADGSTTKIDYKKNADGTYTITKTSTPAAPTIIDNPTNTMGLTKTELELVKLWEDSLDPTQREDVGSEVVLDLIMGNSVYLEGLTLTEESDWTHIDTVTIAPGIMVDNTSPAYNTDEAYTHVTLDGKDYVILETGHEYYFKEEAIDGHFELTNYIYHPMLINGTLYNVEFETNAAGDITGIKAVKAMSEISATNTLKGGINITKVVKDETGADYNDPNPFTVKVTVTDPEGNALPTKTAGGTSYTIDYRIYYGPNNPKYGTEGTSATLPGGRSGHIYVTGTSFTETIYVGDTIRVVNVEDDSLYTVTETVPTGYDPDYTVTYLISEGTADNPQPFPEGEDPSVQGNSASFAEVTNTFVFGSLEVTKTVTVPEGFTKDANKEFTFTFHLYTDSTKGTELTGNKYSYTKTAADGTTSTGTLEVGGTFTLKDGEKIKFDKLPETAYYEVVETAEDGYTATPEGGVASGTIVAKETAEAAFTNAYNAKPVEVDPPVKKNLTVDEGVTAPDIEGKFTFTISGSDGAPMPENESITNSPDYELEDKPGYYEFGVITFTAPGEYEYTVTESGTVSGVTNDEAAESGKTITFTVTDDGEGNLEVTPTTDSAVFEFTNVYKTGDLTVSKTVVSDVESDATRAFNFTVTLSDTTISGTFGDMTFTNGVATFTLTDGQSKTASDLPEGVTYTVTEAEESNQAYTVTKTGDTGTISSEEAATAAFTNERVMTEVPVVKYWADEDYFVDGEPVEGYERPDITIHLLADGTEVASTTLTGATAADVTEWTYTFTNLPKYTDAGVEIVYSVTEDVPAGYEGAYETSTYIVNTPEEEEVLNPTELTIKKVDAETGNIIPTGAVFTIDPAPGEDLPTTYTTGEDGTVTITFEKDGTYTLTETEAPEGYIIGSAAYTIEVEREFIEVKLNTEKSVWEWIYDLIFGEDTEALFDEGTSTLTVENPPVETVVIVEKIWEDNDDQDGVRPDDIQVQLLADGSEVGDPVTLNEDNDWSYGWSELPAYADGALVNYTVEEVVVDKYQTEIEYGGYGVDDSYTIGDGYTVTITNTYAPEQTTYQATKVWDDMDNINGLRPESISVQLQADGTATGDPVTLPTEDGSWTYTWTGLPKYKDGGTEIIYTAIEDPVPTGYTESYVNGTGITTITNTLELTDDVEVTKAWDTNGDTTPPEGATVTFTLYADGEATDYSVELDGTADTEPTVTAGYESEAWVATFVMLPKYNADGEEVEYTVVETGTYDGYACTGSPASNGGTITNSHNDDEKDVFYGDTEINIDGHLASAGDVLTYTISWNNNTNEIGDVTITDKIPDYTEYNNDASPAADFDGSTLTWTIEDVAPGASGSVTFSVTVADDANGEQIVNDATVKVGENESKTNLVTTNIPVKDVLDESGTSIDEQSVQVGDILTYEVTFSIDKPVTSATVTDEVPAGTKYVENSATGDWATIDDSGDTITWTFSGDEENMLEAGTYTVTFQVMVTEEALELAEMTIENTAVIKVNDDPEIETNTVTNTPEVGDLTVSKTVVSDREGDEDTAFTFTIELEDKNGEALTGSYAYSGSSTGTISSGGTFTLKHGESITIEDLPAGATYTVVETAVDGFSTTKTGDTGTIEKDAEATAAFTNTHTEDVKEVTYGTTEINIDGHLASAGDVLTYTITYTNNTSEVGIVTVTDTIPDYTTYNNDASPDADFDGSTLTWTIEDVAPGASGSVTFSVTVADDANGEQIVNDATVKSGENESKTNLVTTNIPVKDVLDESGASIDEQSVQVGDILTYEVTFSIDKPVTSATVTDEVPAGTKYVEGSATGDWATIDDSGDTITWTFSGDEENMLEAGTYTVTFQVMVTEDALALATKTIENTAVINVNDDPNVETNTVTNTPEVGDLTVSKIVTVPEGFEIDEDKAFTFTIELEDKNGEALTGSYAYSGDYEGTISSGGTFTLKHGESITIADLPAGAKYTITEAAEDGYTPATNPMTGTITGGETAVTAEFTNAYNTEPVEASFPVTKILSVPEELDGPEEWEFTIDVEAKNGAPEAAAMTGKVDQDNDTVTFGPFSFVAPGTYTYVVTESGDVAGVTPDPAASAGKSVTITVEDDGEGNLTASVDPEQGITFTNTYDADPVKANFEVTKDLTGTPLTAGAFEFQLTAIDGAPMPEKTSATNDADGKVAFDEIEYTEPGVYEYEITEIPGGVGGYGYDDMTVTVTVTVTDNGEGELEAKVEYSDDTEFNNTYEVSGDWTPTAKKELKGRTLEEGQFTFELVDQDGNVIQTKTNNASGAVQFDTISYDETIFGNSTTGTDDSGEDSGETPSANGAAPVIIDEVADDEAVEPEAVEPEAVETEPEPEATIDETVDAVVEETISDEPAADEPAEDGFDLLDTLANFLGLRGLFSPNIALAEGTSRETTLTYTIREVNDGKPGYTYDDHQVTVTVTIVDDGEGNMTVTPVYDGETTFVNTYKAEGSIEFAGIKTVTTETSKTLEEGQFTFQLKDSDGNVLQEKTNAADGSFAFDAISYTEADAGKEYTYQIVEVNDGKTGYTYDTHVCDVTVKVEDNGDGTLTCTATYSDGEVATFDNPYEPLPTKAPFTGIKEITGKTLQDGEFTFELKDSEGTVVATATNKADGTVDFGEIEFTKEGTYTFTATEVAGTDKNMVYDSADHVYTVEVVDNEGQLEATVTGEDGVLVRFKNEYTPESVTYDPPVTKVIQGNPVKPETFTFQMKAVTEGAPMPAESGNGIKTIQITGAGTKEFGDMEYAETGEWVYEITELKGAADGWTYDTKVYTLTITVTQNADGTLALTPTYTVNGSKADAAVFTNVFTPTTPKTGDVTPMISEIAGIAALGSGLIAAGALRRRRED